MTERELVCVLHEIARREVPDDVTLWPAIRTRVEPIRRPVLVARLRPATRLGWALLGLAVALALGTAAYGVQTILNQMLSQAYQVEPGVRHILDEKLGQELDRIQTVDGVTVTLKQVYADANRIVVGYTVDCRGISCGAEARLTDNSGAPFPLQLHVGQTEGGSRSSGSGWVSVFEADAVQGNPPTLSLDLLVDVTSGSEPLAGPFAFGVDTPFDPGRAVDVERTALAAGVVVRLERLVITPSETRARVCFSPPAGEPDRWHPGSAVLDAGNLRKLDGIAANTDIAISGNEVCARYSFYYPLDDQHGQWTLSVRDLERSDPAEPSGQALLSGPWIFRFEVP